jgi:hypothetical protein
MSYWRPEAAGRPMLTTSVHQELQSSQKRQSRRVETLRSKEFQIEQVSQLEADYEHPHNDCPVVMVLDQIAHRWHFVLPLRTLVRFVVVIVLPERALELLSRELSPSRVYLQLTSS